MTDASPEPSLPPPWWERWPGRLEWEIGEFVARGLVADVVEDPRLGANRLVIETVLELPEHGSTRLIMRYPDGFPFRRFAISAPSLRLPRHQAFGGDLCVLPRGAEYWDPSTSAAEFAAEQVPRLVSLVAEGGEALRAAEDPQGEPFTTYYPSAVQGCVIVDERALAGRFEAATKGTLRIALAHDRLDWLTEGPPGAIPADVGQGYLATAQDAAGADLLGEVPPGMAGRYPNHLDGRWVYIAEPPYAESAQELWDAALAADPALHHWAEIQEGFKVLGICTNEEVRQGVVEPAWVFLVRRVSMVLPSGKAGRSKNPAVNSPKRVASVPLIVRALRWTDDDLAVRVPELAPLRSATVAVVGLGSLGFPFMQEMAKSRVGALRLIDQDFVDPATSVRFPLGLASAGVSKVLAAVHWIKAHNPEVEIDVLSPLRIGGVTNEPPIVTERDVLDKVLKGADLVVGATAEHDVNFQLDDLAIAYGVPRLYLWSQSGFGGIVALLESGRTGCFHCLRLFLSEQAEAGSPLIDVAPDVDGQPAGTIQGRGCADKTFTATHADLLPIAVQAARVAFGRLCAGSGGHPDFEGDVFAVQVRKPDGQPIPPLWTAFDLAPRADCELCNPS